MLTKIQEEKAQYIASFYAAASRLAYEYLKEHPELIHEEFNEVTK